MNGPRGSRLLSGRWLVPLFLLVFAVAALALRYGSQLQALEREVTAQELRHLRERLSLEQTRLDVQSGLGNPLLVRRLVSGLALHQGLNHAYLVGADGRVQGSLSRLHLGQPLADVLSRSGEPPEVLQVLGASRQVPAIDVARVPGTARLVGWVPVAGERRLLVVDDISHPLALRRAAVQADVVREGLVLLAALGLLAAVLHLLWFRRAQRLARTLADMGTGHLSARAGLGGGDELALIGSAADRMAEQLEVGQAQVRHMHDIINRSPLVVIEWRHAPGWPVRYVSASVSQWGYAPEDLLEGNLHYNDLIHPDEVQRINDEVARYLAKGPDEYRQSYRIRCSDGRWAWVEDRTSLVRGADGEVTTISGILLDITAQREAEQVQCEQADRLRMFYDMPFLGMAVSSAADKRWIQVNDRLCELLGYTREELLNMNWAEMTPPGDLERNLVLYDELMAGRREGYRLSKRYRRKDGRFVHTEIDVRPMRRADGSVSELYATVQDVTDRLQAEAELHRLGAMADNASDALLLIVDDIIEDCNPASLRLFGYPDRTDFLGQSPSVLFPPTQIDGTASESAAAQRIVAAMAGEPQRFEWLHQRRDGSVFEAEVSLNRFQLNDGRHAIMGVVRDISERKQREALLKASESQLREAQRIGNMGSWSYDLTTDQVVWSDETYRIHGLDPVADQVVFVSMLQLVHPEDRERVQQAYRESVRLHQAFETRHRVCLKDGRTRHLHLRGETEYRDGRAVRSLGMVVDETELVEAQAARDRLVAVLENTSDIVSMADPQGRVFYFNRAGFEMLGLPPDEPLENVIARVHPQWASQRVLELGIPTALREGLWLGDSAVYNARGDEVPMSQLIGAHRGSDGQVVFLWTIMRDVSERVGTARVLQETKDMLEQGEAVGRMGSFSYDGDAGELKWSRQAFAILGLPWSPQPPSIDEYCACIHPDDAPQVRFTIGLLVAGAEVPEVRFRTHPDRGPTRWLRRLFQRIDRSAEGKGPRYVGTLLDITEAVDAEERLRAVNQALEQRVAERTAQLHQANQELEAFSYTVSHDLKAPLRGIDGYSQLLVEEYGEQLNEDGRQFVGRIRHGVQLMGELINDLLAYSRMERRDMSQELVELLPLVQQVLDSYESDIRRQGVQVQLAMEPFTLALDREGIAVVLRNLIGNALKFSRDSRPPQVEIGSRSEGGRRLLWVRDNGVGFDMKYHDRMFAIFQRLHRAEDFSGTGVGLALVAKAVQRMGGRVWAESTVGAGATFFMEFPE